MTELERYVAGLEVSQGAGAGAALALLPWEKKFLRRAFRPGVHTAALTTGRGSGKSTLAAAIAAAAVDGPLAQRRAETIVVASSFQQGRVLFEHTKAFLDPVLVRDGVGPRGRFRIQDSINQASIEDRLTGSRVRCLGSDPRRAHGLAPALVLADEPAQWEHTKSAAMLSALRTGLGKIPNSRFVALGTRPSDTGHWFALLLSGGADYSQVHAARGASDEGKADPPFQVRTWRKANPSLSAMPALLAELRGEAQEARRDPSMLASFEALRLNLGTGETLQSSLLDADTWERIEVEGAAHDHEGYSLGIDLGQNAAMSAAAGYWPSTGALDALAVFPELPSLKERGLSDGVGRLYSLMAERGELLQAGRRVSDVLALLREALRRWGAPAVITCDRWREAELRQSLESVAFPLTSLVVRGQGFKDGAADVRSFRAACLAGKVSPVKSLLLRSAMAEARVVMDVSANAKLAKKTQGGRRAIARDDAVAAAILAVASGCRLYRPSGGGSSGLRAVVV